MKFTGELNSAASIAVFEREKLLKYFRPGPVCLDMERLDSVRSLPEHRRYFARLHALADNMPAEYAMKFWEICLADLAQCEGVGSAELLHKLIEEIVGIDSIAFSKLDQDAAHRYFLKADEILDRWMTALGITEDCIYGGGI